VEKQENIQFTEKELAALRSEYASTAKDTQFSLWIEHCRRRNLVPVQDVLLQIRTNKEWDPEVGAKVAKKRIVFITTIGGLRKIAERTGLYEGPLATDWVYLSTDGSPSVYSKVPLPPNPAANDSKLKFRQPWAAIAYIVRTGWKSPVQCVARFDAYAQSYTKDNKTYLTSMWATRGPEQLEKCAKAGAFREAFPETHGLYIAEELEHEVEVEAPASTTQQQAPPPVITPGAVNQEPAKPTETPRPILEGLAPHTVTTDPDGTRHEEYSIHNLVPPPRPSNAQPDLATNSIPKPRPNVPANSIPQKASPEFKKKLADLKEEMKPNGVVNANSLDPKPVQEVRKPEATPEPDRIPTLAEKKKLGAHLKTIKADSDLLKAWICRFTGATSIQAMTKNQYEKAIAKLDAVTELGQAALDSLLKEQPSGETDKN